METGTELGDVIVADTRGASDVYAMHGGVAVARWKCLARRIGLAGPWEAIELSTLPPGAECGVHHHSRTQELYFIVAGEGELLLDGTIHRVRPGHLVANPLGTRHRLDNPGRGDLDWLVIEVLAPPVAAALTGEHPDPDRRSAMSPATVFDLTTHGPVELADLLGGPLQRARIADLAARTSEEYAADGVEHTLFVLDGSGTARSGRTEVALAPGTSVTLPLGSRLTVTAGPAGLSCFHASLRVPERSGGRP